MTVKATYTTTNITKVKVLCLNESMFVSQWHKNERAYLDKVWHSDSLLNG